VFLALVPLTTFLVSKRQTNPTFAHFLISNLIITTTQALPGSPSLLTAGDAWTQIRGQEDWTLII
jgi:hypothetical protein